MEKLHVVPEIKNLTPKMPSKKEVVRKRLYAFITDIYAIVILNKVLSFTWVAFINAFFINTTLNVAMASNIISGTSKLSLGIIFLSYFTFFYYLGDGKTIGKMIFGLKVCSNHNHNKELTFMEAFSRSMGYLFCNFMWFLPFATIFLRRDAKSICDYISHTSVLTEAEMAIIENLEEHEVKDTHQMEMFPEDPVSVRLRKIS